MTMTEPAFRYIVIRAAADLPAGFLPPEWEGKWLDVDTLLLGYEPQVSGGIAVATDRFERRDDDGATARVYEVRR